MASTINLSGLAQYTDQLSQPLVREAVLEGTTFKYITVIPDVPYSTALNEITSVLVPQAGGCGLSSPTGSVTLAQRSLQVCPIKVEENVCEDDLKQYWTGKLMQAGSYVEELSPKQFAQIYAADKVAKLAAVIEDYYWQGDTSGTYSASFNLCNGILHVLESTSASASVVSGNGTYSGALTVTNALNVIDGMITTMNTSVSDIVTMPDLTIFMSYANFNTLLVAIRGNGSQGSGFFHNSIGQDGHDFTFMYPGQPIRIIATRGLNGTNVRNKMVLTYASNLAYGCDLETDYSKFRIWYEELYDDVRFRAKFKIGAQCYYPQYIVMYK